MTNSVTPFLVFDKNKIYFIRIFCQQAIVMKYHTLFVIFEKSGKILNCRLLQITGGALWVKYQNFICWLKLLKLIKE